jgi:cystathionine beta-lyase/cystathionine gamma-synthase
MRKSSPPYALRKGLATLAARGVRAEPPGAAVGRPSSEPIYQTAVFDFPDIASSEPALNGAGGYAYARYGQPNEASLAASVAALEGAEAGVATSSGTSAVLCALLIATRPGDLVLCQRDAYGGTRHLLEREITQFGRRLELVDAYEPAKVADGLARGARLALVETLSNPLLREVDIAALAWHCRSYNAQLCVDNTFATPVLQQPVALGADLVVHSATKFLGGHHDCTAGVLVGPREMIAEARALVTRLGLNAAPFDAWLATRGMRTLPLRVQRAEQNARALAEKLRAHARVRAVHFPGWGGLLSFELEDRAAAERLVRACPQLHYAPSLGGVETTLMHPASSSHRMLDANERAAIGIAEGLLRMSLGIEDADDLWSELSQGLNKS